jgi:radical SAM protein with 4Fe4S-binding SPASM domain
MKSPICDMPWTGVFSVRTNGAVIFCPCFAQVEIGNIRQASLREIWNSATMQDIRASFRDDRLPPACEGQLCPVVLGEGYDLHHAARDRTPASPKPCESTPAAASAPVRLVLRRPRHS